ncbi:MAG: hypothetical protein N3G18_00650 [Candidatus Saccharicenans sp.]|nr:hypothetical protein [Candidatus Saccharicenans sp.]
MLDSGRNIKTSFAGLALFVALAAGLLSWPVPAQAGQGGLRLQAAFSEAEIRNLARNFEYSLLDGSKYRLKNGLFESGEGLDNYVSVKLVALAVGDLDRDGYPEAAAILVSNFGGSGSFYELTVLVNRGQELEQTNNLELGDRVEVRKLTITGGRIRIDLLTHGPEDPMCCPSRKTTLICGLAAGRLQLLDKRP